MLLNVLAAAVLGALCAGLLITALIIRRRQRALRDKREAAQLQRRADHLFKIALATQVHTRHNAIAGVLLAEAVRVLEYSTKLDCHSAQTINSLRECRELLDNLGSEQPRDISESHDPILEYPETELIEAQLHLTEAVRVLIGLEKRGQLNYEQLSKMTVALKQAQRALDLRLQLRQATHALGGDRNSPKSGDAAGEFFDKGERDRAQISH